MEGDRVVVKKEVKKYATVDVIIHHAALALGAILIITGVGVKFWSGGFWEVSHFWAGVLFSIVVVSHLCVLIARGVTKDIPIGRFPFLFSVREFLNYLKGIGGMDAKFSVPERVDYFSLMFFSVVVSASGIFLRFPNLLPGRGGIDVVFTMLSVHFTSAVGFTFWVVAVHVLNTVVSPFPGNDPMYIFGREVDIEAVREHRPGWFEELEREGAVEVLKEEDPEEKIDREKVESLLNEGNRNFREGNFEDAERLYREAIALYPAYSQAHYNLAVLLKKMGRYAEAIGQCRRFLEVDPFHPLSIRVKEMIREMEEGPGAR